MKKKLEHFNVELISGNHLAVSIIKNKSNWIYFVGHRFEDHVCVNTLLLNSDFKESLQYKDSVVGKVTKDKLNLVVEFLMQNFISGYIIWFDDSVMYSIHEFGSLFIENKKTCLLTSIYYATQVGADYFIEVPESFHNIIRGMVFTESGESSISLIRK